jgi:hypothetical protein
MLSKNRETRAEKKGKGGPTRPKAGSRGTRGQAEIDIVRVPRNRYPLRRAGRDAIGSSPPSHPTVASLSYNAHRSAVAATNSAAMPAERRGNPELGHLPKGGLPGWAYRSLRGQRPDWPGGISFPRMPTCKPHRWAEEGETKVGGVEKDGEKAPVMSVR